MYSDDVINILKMLSILSDNKISADQYPKAIRLHMHYHDKSYIIRLLNTLGKTASFTLDRNTAICVYVELLLIPR